VVSNQQRSENTFDTKFRGKIPSDNCGNSFGGVQHTFRRVEVPSYFIYFVLIYWPLPRTGEVLRNFTLRKIAWFDLPPDAKRDLVGAVQLVRLACPRLLLGTGSPKREFIHSDDLASAIYVCLENYKSNEPINIGTGFELSIKEIAELISEIMGYSGSIHWDESWPDGTPRKLLDSSKIMSLGWSPSITLDIGLRSTINWYEENVQSLKG
jgi:hypothetical protein